MKASQHDPLNSDPHRLHIPRSPKGKGYFSFLNKIPKSGQGNGPDKIAAKCQLLNIDSQYDLPLVIFEISSLDYVVP